MTHFRFLFRRSQEVKSDWSFQAKWVLIVKILTDLSAHIADPVTFLKQEIKKNHLNYRKFACGRHQADEKTNKNINTLTPTCDNHVSC